MRYAKDDADSITFPVQCKFCKNGIVTETHSIIDPKVLEYHIEHHASRAPDGSRMGAPAIGANCRCPRINRRYKRKCIACIRTPGTRQVTLKVGQVVTINNSYLLEQLEVADEPAKIIAINDAIPEWDGDVVTVTWDLTDKGSIKKSADSYMVKLSEIRV